MGNDWTKDQRAVIAARNGNLLVSAAAGSGKTAVLVERILQRITDPKQPVDIDRILVVTFTRAAAGEMRERIRQSLENALRRKPYDRNLQRQSVLVHHAKIMTIHGFCLDVIRSHFNEIGLDPVMRVAEEGELVLLRQDALEQILEEAYERGEPSFLAFSEAFAQGRTDDGLEELIDRFYEYSMGFPDPALWRQSCRKSYMAADCEELERLPWVRGLCAYAQRQLEESRNMLQRALELCRESGGPWRYIDVLEEDLQLVEELKLQRSYAQLQRALANGIAWKRLPGKSDPDVLDEKKDAVKALRGQAKGLAEALAEKIFTADADTLLTLLEQGRSTLEALLTLCDAYEERYAQAKRDRGIVDFHDLEHFALRILVEWQQEEAVPTEAAKEYAGYFQEILIDEYQDSNLSQEVLLRSISGEANHRTPNRFMVGDVKQSIYRFRLARPELFIEKQDTYEETEGAPYRKISLRRNFRSRRPVLELVNRIFFAAMRRSIGHVEYDADAALYAGAAFAEDPSFIPELWIAHAPLEGEAPGGREENPMQSEPEGGETDTEAPEGEEESREELERRQAEALLSAKRILELTRTGQVTDRESGALRPVRFGDIAVLLRTMSGWGDVFAQTFSSMGIPVRMESGSGYFEALEIRIMLAALAVLDNPRQDIPLAGVLHSVIGGFDDLELANIRADIPDGTFYSACIRRSLYEDALGMKLRGFFAMLAGMRSGAAYTPIHELIRKISDETGYGSWVRSLPAGEARFANLRMLEQRAEDYERGSGHGLFRFLRYIDQLKKQKIDYPEALPEGAGSDAVRIMSVHKSKGLEFPVVFVSGLGKAYNRSSEREKLLLHAELGAGFDLVDPGKRLRFRMPLRRAIALQIREEELGEELRVLYVALTRAREKLILTGYTADPERAIARWQKPGAVEAGRLSYDWKINSASWLDLIGPLLVSGMLEETCDVHWTNVDQLQARQQQDAADISLQDWLKRAARGTCMDAQMEAVCRTWREAPAPYPDAQGISPVLSVSELKHAWMDQLEEGQLPPEQLIFVNSYAPGGETAGAAAVGTMYHRVMELLDFAAAPEGDAVLGFVQMQLENMRRCGKIAEDVLQHVSAAKVAAFLGSSAGRRMSAAHRRGTLFRETPFVLGLPAAAVREDWKAQEMVMVQGIIDVWFEEEDGAIVLLDYKTDALPKGGMDVLCRRYQMQIHYYKEALQQLTGKHVKEALLYSFSLEETADCIR